MSNGSRMQGPEFIRANIHIAGDLWKAVRIAALERNISASKLVTDAVTRLLSREEAGS
jgi:hypothetical protein